MTKQQIKNLETWGFSPDEAPSIIVWPENKLALHVFRVMQSQRHMSMSGALALNYASLPEMWQRLKVPEEERDDVFFALMAMDDAWLEARYADKE